MKLIELPNLSLDDLAGYATLLAELNRLDRMDQAEALAWAAIETLSAQHPPSEMLKAAGPFLLALGESEGLRGQVTELYKAAFADRETLQVLLDESGIAGGRPVRRALRTLGVCLALSEGDFLTSRDDDGVARVDAISPSDWQFDITTERGRETLGPVHLADRYQPAEPDDIRVARRFAPDQFAKQLAGDPAAVVMAVCKLHGNKIDRDDLENYLVGDWMDEGEWKKWWTRARTALKKYPNIQIERRAPYTIAFTDEAVSPEDVLVTEFNKLHEPLKQLEAVERYLRECKAQKRSVSPDALKKTYENFHAKAARRANREVETAWLTWIIARRLGELAGVNGAADRAIALYAASDEPARLFGSLRNDVLEALALETLVEARPHDWQDQLIGALPMLPMSVCERAAERLVQAGRRLADFEPVVEKIIGSPVAHFEALLWLWDGPSISEHLPELSRVTLIARMLRALDDARRDAELDRSDVRKLGARARSVLSARRYERFRQSLDDMEPGLANALRRQISRQDGFGRAVKEDLLKLLHERFPVKEQKPRKARWEREDVIYVTRERLVRKQNEIEHHVNVTMRENAIAIGRAAERGDLSENSEYKFALEERDLLRARLAQMNAEVALAQILPPDEVPTDHIGVGTKVVFKRVSDGEVYEVSLVGPWEADLAASMLNYKTPIAQKMLGARIGDVITFEHSAAQGEYEVAALYNVLAELEASDG